jgi:gliding motility-associated-like protein
VVCSDWLNWNTSWWRGLNYDCDKKKWRYTLWDEDATFKHYINYTAVPNLNVNANPCDPQSLGNPGSQGHIPIINKLLTNPTFKQYYVMRYFDLINSGLSCTRMTQILDSMILVIKPEMPAQIAKWGGTMTEWQNNVNALKTFIQQRCDTLTKLFNTCYNVTGPYKIKINVNPPNSGTVDFNSLNISSFVWQGTYPGNLPNNLKAHAKANYCFSHWTTKTHTLSPSMNDSIVSLLLSGNDSIVAHFIYNPKITATPVSSVICQGGTVQLSASNGVNYSWQPNTGLSCSTCSNPIVSPSSSTTYTVTSFNNPSCKTSATTTITVAANAVASFTAASTQTATLPQTITVTNTSSQASSFSWTFNNGTPTITPNPKFLVNTPGTYTISMIAFGSNNCNDTTSGIVIIHDTTKVYPIVPTVFMPNVFTPNNDGVNDAFHPVMKGFKEANCTIIDRWGVQVFELKEVNAVWYGENSNGNPCPAGTYFYIFNGVDLNNKDYTYKGFVQLIR